MLTLYTAWWFLLLSGPTTIEMAERTPVKISADVIEVDHQGQQATLTGSVQVHWEELGLTADQIKIQYDADGAPKHWRAIGNVRLKWRTYTLSSTTLKVDQTKTALVFWGPLDVIQGQTRLKAQKATLYFTDKRFVVEKVTGEMNLKDLLKTK